MTRSPGRSARKPHTYDLEAFDELAALADRASTAFARDAIDRGLDRLIQHPDRNTSGRTLALRLTRDARKFLRTNRRREILTDEIDPRDLAFDPPTATDLADIRHAVAVIRFRLHRIGLRLRLVLATKANCGTADALSVKARQYRNLVASARERLWAEPGVAVAREIVTEALTRWRFETIDLLAPLTAGLYSAN